MAKPRKKKKMKRYASKPKQNKRKIKTYGR